jgi:hypothetical protein
MSGSPTGAVVRGCALAAVLVFMLAPPAFAGTAEIRYTDEGRLGTSAVLGYTALPGERNELTVSIAGEQLIVFDAAGATPAAGCSRPDPADARRVHCVSAPHAAFSGVNAQLGDGDDKATVVGTFASLHGGDGDDVLHGASTHGTTFVGGPGDDQMFGGAEGDNFDERSSGNGSDVMQGGNTPLSRFSDRVDYSGRRRGISADLSGDRDDGEPGERDQIGADVDDLAGGAGDDRLVGNRADNYFTGGPGTDVLVGGPGQDDLTAAFGEERTRDRLDGGEGEDLLIGSKGANTLTGGPGSDRFWADAGDDRILARDGSIDDINCRAGRDRVRQDGTDFLADRCERTDPDRLRAAVPVKLDIEYGAYHLPSAVIGLGCPRRGPRTCAGNARIEHGGAALGNASFTIPQGRGGFVKIDLPAELIDRLRPQIGAPMDIVVTSTDARGRPATVRAPFELRVAPGP